MGFMLTIATTIVTLLAPAPEDTRQRVTDIVAKIQRADYEGDRPALTRLHGELAPFVRTQALASRVLYWRGFALWRKSLNGFNESADRKELDADLTQAIADLREAVTHDPAFVDAKIGEASCLVNLSFLHLKDDPARAGELYAQSANALDEAAAAASENPRL